MRLTCSGDEVDLPLILIHAKHAQKVKVGGAKTMNIANIVGEIPDFRNSRSTKSELITKRN